MAALHFTTENPEEQMYADFGNLNKFDDESFKSLSIIVFQFLADPQQVGIACSCFLNVLESILFAFVHLCLQSGQFVSQLEEFAGEHSLGINALKNVIKSFLIISFCNLALLPNKAPGPSTKQLYMLKGFPGLNKTIEKVSHNLCLVMQ